MTDFLAQIAKALTAAISTAILTYLAVYGFEPSVTLSEAVPGLVNAVVVGGLTWAVPNKPAA